MLALIAALLSVGVASPARAHATLVASDPADGAVVAAPPARFTLSFNEPVSPLVLRLVRPDGAAEVLQAPGGRKASLVIEAPAGLPHGTHVLSWRVVSLDGHPVGGSIVFSVGAPSAGPAPTVSQTDPAVLAALWLCKLIFYVGAFVGIGGSLFRAWLAPWSSERPPSIAVMSLVAGLVVTPVLVGLQGAEALAIPLRGLANRAVWQAGLETSFGATAIAAACALFGGVFALLVTSRGAARGLSLFGLLVLGLALALSGHASAAAPQWLTRPAVFIHVVTLTFWIGSLIPLAAALRHDTGTAALAAFSRAIPWAIAALVASGVVLAVIQVEEPRLLLTTAYGRLLCAKLLLVAALLVLAAWNRFRLTPGIAAGRAPPRRQLRRTIAIELVIIAVILGLVAAWRFTPPPRALAIAAARPALVHIHTAAAMADVKLEPGHAGPVRVEIVLMTGDFGPLDAKELQLIIENKAAGIEAISRSAVKGTDALWRVEQLVVPTGGRWNVRLDILVNDFQKVMLEDAIEIPHR
jgi:copper transport protein